MALVSGQSSAQQWATRHRCAHGHAWPYFHPLLMLWWFAMLEISLENRHQSCLLGSRSSALQGSCLALCGSWRLSGMHLAACMIQTS